MPWRMFKVPLKRLLLEPRKGLEGLPDLGATADLTESLKPQTEPKGKKKGKALLAVFELNPKP